MLRSLAVLTALAVCSVAAAHATSITGIINIDGSDNYQSTTAIPGYAYELTFANAALGGTETGSFASLPMSSVVTMFPTFTTGEALPFNLGVNPVPPSISPVEVMSVVSANETFDYYITDYTASLVSGVGCSELCLDVTGDGFFTGTGTTDYSETPGIFTFTTQQLDATQTTDTTFSATGFATPEPASLALVGTGLLGLVGLARRKLMV